MDLLEREAQREVVRSALDRLDQSQGSILLVSGEAGVGKTSFVADSPLRFAPAGLVFWGACDPLFTPRPLGPLYDIALQRLRHLLDLLDSGANWLTVAWRLIEMAPRQPGRGRSSSLRMCTGPTKLPSICSKYLGRRIEQTHSLLILTYRDDEAGSQHPLEKRWAIFQPGNLYVSARTPVRRWRWRYWPESEPACPGHLSGHEGQSFFCHRSAAQQG